MEAIRRIPEQQRGETGVPILHSEGVEASKKSPWRGTTRRQKEAQRKVVEYGCRIFYLSSEGVGGDLEQRADTTIARLDH